MEAAEYCDWLDRPGAMGGSMDRRVLVQREVSSHPVAIVCVGFENSAQMGLAEHDDMVEALAANRCE